MIESKKYKVLGEIQVLQQTLRKVQEMQKIQLATAELDKQLLEAGSPEGAKDQLPEGKSQEDKPGDNQTTSSRPASQIDRVERQETV